jgi:hypothetical protein
VLSNLLTELDGDRAQLVTVEQPRYLRIPR